MKDASGKPITPGATLKRIVENHSAPADHEYTVILYDFYGNGKEDLVADGGFIKELLDLERAKEYEVLS